MSRILVNELGARTGTDIAIKSGSTLGGADSQLKITGGSAGQILTTNGLGVLTWSTIDALPTQTGQTGKFLTTDGTDASWETVSGAEISELNNFFKNWNVIDTTITTTVAPTENAAIIGPLDINTTGKWNIDGKVTIM